MEQHKEEGDLVALGGKAIGIAAAVALQQAVGFHLAEVITELIQAVGGEGEIVGFEHGLVDLLGAPTAQLGTGMEKYLHEADHASVVDLDDGFIMHLVQLRLRFRPDPV